MAAWLTCLPTKRSRLAFGAPSPASESPRRVVLKALAHGMHDALRRASTPPGRPRLSRRSAQQLAESSRHWPCRSAGTAKASLNKLSRVECDQSAENDNRQRRLDLLPWTFAEHDRRNQRQAGGKGSHQDRSEAFSSPTHHQVPTEGHAFLALQVLEMVDQQDLVPSCNAEDRKESDQRPERASHRRGRLP
jgi:hypothetical protein